MGPISKKLARRFAKWSGQFRQSARNRPIPKDVRDVGSLVKDGHDPLHAVYISCRISRRYSRNASRCFPNWSPTTMWLLPPRTSTT